MVKCSFFLLLVTSFYTTKWAGVCFLAYTVESNAACILLRDHRARLISVDAVLWTFQPEVSVFRSVAVNTKSSSWIRMVLEFGVKDDLPWLVPVSFGHCRWSNWWALFSRCGIFLVCLLDSPTTQSLLAQSPIISSSSFCFSLLGSRLFGGGVWSLARNS